MEIVPLSTDFTPRPIYEEVGFDYARAVLQLKRYLTYDDIAQCCGYESARSVLSVLTGAIPSHIRGEAIWALYVEVFGHRPPLRPQKYMQKQCGVTT